MAELTAKERTQIALAEAERELEAATRIAQKSIEWRDDCELKVNRLRIALLEQISTN